ncbi:hypothetical protein IFVP182_C2200059 [Vibrio parahaemolyticus]
MHVIHASSSQGTFAQLVSGQTKFLSLGISRLNKYLLRI